MFELMAQKTVMKQLLSKYAPLSTELQKAIEYDQAVVSTDGKPTYVDNITDVKEKPSGTINNVEQAVKVE